MKHEKLTTILQHLHNISRLVAMDVSPANIIDSLDIVIHEVQSLGHKSPIRLLKKAIGDFTRPNYWQWATFWVRLNDLLTLNEMGGVHAPICSNQGEKTFTLESLDETLLTYLHVTWYRMESGQFEFVAYITE